MYKALLLGCGNIGALYDLEKDEVQTHAKAYFNHPGFELTVFDQNKELEKVISEKYYSKRLVELSDDTFRRFDCISICTPTATHYEFLKKAIEGRTRLIICEKPISTNVKELKYLLRIYEKGKSKILVNYIRRFQPNYLLLKKDIKEILKNEKLTNISVRYQRGFINNCSHAFDLIQYFLDKELDFKNVAITNSIHDHFEDDPTLSMNCKWEQTNISILGLTDVKFSLFEIELYFEYCRISILQSGNSIIFHQAEQNERFLQPLNFKMERSNENCLSNYMESVIEKAHQILQTNIGDDNFANALKLNQKMLTLLKV